MTHMQREVMEHLLTLPNTGIVATLRKDGRPYTVPIWWLWKDDFIWLIGTETRIWCKQLIRDPRMSLCIEQKQPWTGHIGIDGIAEPWFRSTHDIWPIARLLAEKFVGRGDLEANREAVDKFYANMQTEPRMLFKVTPEVWRAIDLRVYRGKRADREFQAKFIAERDS